MARECCDMKGISAATLADSGACLFYGAVLTSRSRGASLMVYDVGHITTGHAPATQIKLWVYNGNNSQSVSVFPPIPAKLASGCFVSLSAGAHGTIFFAKRQ